MSGFHRLNTQAEDQQKPNFQPNPPISRQHTSTQKEDSLQSLQHQNSISTALDTDKRESQTNGQERRKSKQHLLKDERKMKRYLIKIWEKMQHENQSNSSIHSGDSPDPLNEHSNSVQEQLLKKDGQSSLSDINNQIVLKGGKGSFAQNGRNGIGNKKMQFYTSNNFYPASSQFSKNQPVGKQTKQKSRQNDSTVKETFIKEESSDDNNNHVISEEDEDEGDDDATTGNRQPQILKGMERGSKVSRPGSRNRKIKKNAAEIQNHATSENFNQISQPISMYSNQTGSNNLNHSFMGTRNKLQKNQDSYYNDQVVDRSVTNRTPLLEQYQNQHHSLTRNHGQHFASNNSTSVPRPTIASELKLLREARVTPQPTVIPDDGKGTSNQFLHNNNLASFMWNKGSATQEQMEDSHREGNRVRREYNIHDGTTSAVRPLTRSNQRRPISRQVNQVDSSGINATKLMAQQQMHNTHFGDGGFGFGSKFRGDLNLDSDRKISRKRGNTKVQNDEDHKDYVYQREGTVTSKIAAQVGNGTLNRSITFNQQSNNNKVTTTNKNLNTYNNDQVSTQESSGQHFYQQSSFLNKSIEIKQQQQQNQNEVQEPKTQKKLYSKINVIMSGTSYENNSFKMIQRNNSHQQNCFGSGVIGKDSSMSPPLKPIEEEPQKREGKIIIGASSTSTKFYIPSQKTSKIVAKASRNTNISNKAADISADNAGMRSYNTTQEKFFPQRQAKQSATDAQKHQTFYNYKNSNSKSECQMSLEFNGREVKSNPYQQIRSKKATDMIREEQYEEISEDDTPHKRQGNRNTNNSTYEAYHETNSRSILDENYSKELNQQPLYMHQVERPTNRLGGSRAFNQTKSDWKNAGNEYSGQAHSLTRNYHDMDQSSKSTSSAASLTMSKQNIPTSTGGTNTNNNSSISPKPSVKWPTKDTSQMNQSFFQTTNQQKIQEMQKEVNLMYLGGLNQKKKASAGIKLNPINRVVGQSVIGDHSYQL